MGYEANQKINESFQQKCKKISKLCLEGKSFGGTHKAAPIKKEVRTMYKFIYKYNYDARHLTDIVRTSFIFEDASKLWAAVKTVDEAFGGRLWAEGGVVCMKDRLTEAPASGYSDVLLNVRYQGIICEVQLHLKEFIKLKGGKGGMHAAYKKARHFGTDFEKICYQM